MRSMFMVLLIIMQTTQKIGDTLRLIWNGGNMTTSKERQEFRKEALTQLRALRKEAYSKMTCIEYDAIRVAIHLIEMTYNENEKV